MSGAALPAFAAVPADPCASAAVASTVQDGLMQIAPRSLQPQQGWQRQGRDIDIAIRSPLLPNTGTAHAFVCFRWKGITEESEAAKPYHSFVQAASTGAVLPLANTAGQLKFQATVPKNLPAAPASLRSPEKGKPLGVYGRNNAYPVSDVRVVVFVDDAAKPILDLTSSIGVIGAEVYCDMPYTDTTADSGVAQLGEHKNWQPFGGEFEFTVKSSKVIPTNAMVKVCFRWKLAEGDPGPFFESGPTHMVDRQPQNIKVAAIVQGIPNQPSWLPGKKRDAIEPRIGDFAIPVVNLVPLADARILVIDTDGSPVADVLTTVGITNFLLASLIVLATIAVAFVVLWVIGKRRLSTVGECGPLLCIITTSSGYASLSQFQIILWTFVVIASAAYVMALSGDLIEITTGTLVLLGISGTTTVISKAKGEQEAKAAPPPLDPAQAAADAEKAEREARQFEIAAAAATGKAKKEADAAAAEARAIAQAAQARAAAAVAVAAAKQKRAAVADAPDTQKQAAVTAAEQAESSAQRLLEAAAKASANAEQAARARHPRWSDLVLDEVQGRELDVTRIQMLYFTMVTAAFVLLKVITSYQIPVIPDGFLILMGISNSVYVGSKFAGGTAGK